MSNTPSLAPAVTVAEAREAVEYALGQSRDSRVHRDRLVAAADLLRDVEARDNELLALAAVWESDADDWERSGRLGWQYVSTARREMAKTIRRLAAHSPRTDAR